MQLSQVTKFAREHKYYIIGILATSVLATALGVCLCKHKECKCNCKEKVTGFFKGIGNGIKNAFAKVFGKKEKKEDTKTN